MTVLFVIMTAFGLTSLVYGFFGSVTYTTYNRLTLRYKIHDLRPLMILIGFILIGLAVLGLIP